MTLTKENVLHFYILELGEMPTVSQRRNNVTENVVSSEIKMYATWTKILDLVSEGTDSINVTQSDSRLCLRS